MPTYNPITLNRTQDDAQAIAILNAITSAGVTPTAAMTNAAHFFVTACKWASLWSKFTAVYGLMGGTAASHAINWKTPGTFNITWGGTALTHNANGVTGNGAGYGDTGINPNSVFTANNSHACNYARSLIGANQQHGCYDSTGGTRMVCFGGYFDGSMDIRLCTLNAATPTKIVSAKPGVFISTRNSSQLVSVFTGGVFKGLSASISDGLPARNMTLMARNGPATVADFTTNTESFFSFGTGLTNQNAQDLAWIVQATQKILSRDV